MSRIAASGVEEIRTDVGAGLACLEPEGGLNGGTGVIGFCFGGRAAFTAAPLFPELAGTVDFYGPGIAEGPHAILDRFEEIAGKVQMLVGDADPTIPGGHLRAIEEACGTADADLRIETFAGAGHAFHCDARPQAYHAEATRRLRTGVPDVFAAGDVTPHPGKVRIMAVGFGEAATAVSNLAAALRPDEAVFPGHSTELAGRELAPAGATLIAER